ncbi:peptide deformylase [Termitidicoccus mucosus]|uniref:Peptide deformylase n=1 Tax=Termitidicoccus mucosus TaxID=1184151 RepID=A0A178IAE6_9BACT|nr:peptide deformylase [Opitutaceae bacterium TSB47]
MLLPIVQYNDPVLRKKGVNITVFDDALAQLGRDMIETMNAANGIGLAAQQIGRAIQFCVVDVSRADPDFDWDLDGSHPPLELFMPMMIANPVIKKHAAAGSETDSEGCLSFGKIRGEVERPSEITVMFQDAQGVPHTFICNGLLARCIQHETDHLNGVLFIDRMAKKERAKIDAAIKAHAKATKEGAAKGLAGPQA